MFTPCPAAGGDLDLATLRGLAIADAAARFRRAGGAGATLACGLDAGVARKPLDALAIGFDWTGAPAAGDATVQRWAHWLIAKLDASGSIYQRGGEGWRLRTGKLHEESERRLDELAGWSDAAIAEQRKLLEHVDDPGDDGTDLEQSLSKLAAAGWSVDSKKDKKAPAVHFAAGDLPLARGDDWRADGAVHPRLAAALAFFVAALPEDERGAEEPPAGALAAALPALAVTRPDDAAALLDIRTVAKALRDAGGLDLASGEPLGPVLQPAPFRLRATGAKGGAKGDEPAGAGAAAAAEAEPTGAATEAGPAVSESTGADATKAGPAVSEPTGADAAEAGAAVGEPTADVNPNGAAPRLDPNDAAALIAAHGGEAVRFALLHAAAPAKRFRGGDDVVGYAAGFLARARELAARIDGGGAGERIDPDDGLRRRLAGWCDVASARSAENHERLDLHRATRNAVTLLARIGDFEAAVAADRGEVAGADREAVAVAAGVLARLLAPLAPATAGEFWQRGGRSGSPDEAAWPQAQREAAAAA